MDIEDKNFRDFDNWYKSQLEFWKKENIEVEKSNYHNNIYGHSYGIFIKFKNGYGEIHLYESNNIYWVDFFAIKDLYDLFAESNITGHEAFLNTYVRFIQYISDREALKYGEQEY